MQRTTAIVAGAAILAMALIAAVLILTSKSEHAEPSAGDQALQRSHELQVACLESGGDWEPPIGAVLGGNYCEHSESTNAAPATSGGGGSGGTTIGEIAAPSAEQFVDETYSVAEQATFCVSVAQLGYTTTRRQWKSLNHGQHPSGTEVFDELFSRCV